MTDTRTLGAAAQRAGEAASAALENVLVDVLSACPCKAACVVATE